MISNRFDDSWQSKIINIPFEQRVWLTNHDSLTQRIQKRCKQFQVQRISQGLAKINSDEASIIHLSSFHLAHVREVYLHCGKTPMIFARTTLNRNDLRGTWRHLTQMGNRPLGASLFSNPRIFRGALHFRKINRYHPLYLIAVKELKNPPPNLLARRSVFMLNQLPILVTEVFLPGIFALTP